MTVDRRFLYWGVFFVAAGAVMVAVDLRALDPGRVLDALSLWPLALVAVGAAIVLRRTRVNPAAWVVAAVLPGLVLGGAVAAAPHVAVGCTDGSPSMTQRATGAFAGTATVSVTVACGTMNVTTAPGEGWTLSAGNTGGVPAVVEQTPSSLSITSGNLPHAFGFDRGGQDRWQLALPTSELGRLDLEVSAGDGTAYLGGAQIGSLHAVTNAGRLTIDLSGATVGDIDATLNAGQLSVRLPDGQDSSAVLVANAGLLQVCVPSDLGIQIQRSGVLQSLTVGGLQVSDSTWQSPDYALAAHHADLTVHDNLAGIEINPNGGCK